MTLQEFKKQRAELIAKLAFLTIDINEQGNYFANCDIKAHFNWVYVDVYKHVMKNNKLVDRPSFYSRMHRPYFTMTCSQLDFDGESNQYELIIADLQHSYNEMLKFLEV